MCLASLYFILISYVLLRDIGTAIIIGIYLSTGGLLGSAFSTVSGGRILEQHFVIEKRFAQSCLNRLSIIFAIWWLTEFLFYFHFPFILLIFY